MTGRPEDVALPHIPEESIEDLYERAPCGYVSTLLNGRIIRANATFAEWTGYTGSALVDGRKFQDLLTPGSRIFHETHMAAILRVSGVVREIAADIQRADGSRLPVLYNAVARPVAGPGGPVPLVRFTLLDASERRRYEQELLAAKREAEAALARIRQLERLLPVCSWCRRIQSPGGEWSDLEAYLHAAGTQVTHGICETCTKDFNAKR
ncbi:hypothetical protein TBR22_A18380 [Luteitalea sp. TBR-22]|uniref:PAS domain S-box protein n=1 Tax=Luteitalea sp. TBR-22 TaxID=2802971 RepID=UPI001AFBA729|nr:PAS domain-containing protein [Luteitalea sp. TBR-22]BCS32624.1 hypothetical protein TBR22_A18380 [Luteitalea sp. TBR-22]